MIALSEERPRGTILVVDDDDTVLALLVFILRRAGFCVLSASGGLAALSVARETAGKIDMLLSDIDMPGMSGVDVGEELKKLRPDLRVMLMSGGVNGNLLVLNYGWTFIQKPFVPARIVQLIEDVLHSPDRSQPGGQGYDTRKNLADSDLSS